MEDRGLQTTGGPQSVGDGGSGTSKNRYVMEERRSATTDDRRSHNRICAKQRESSRRCALVGSSARLQLLDGEGDWKCINRFGMLLTSSDLDGLLRR
ncbi:hypothetical protein E3N88_16270 [Mikania micrantha]|uniref:Uncharacterized protein n=1 Tax=Mikania micrantha TaxID=192012 RepID=A0A5N6NXV2_9ASTR|nr:hypothetical protein E3N88_16270 [Mikania micrantha]